MLRHGRIGQGDEGKSHNGKRNRGGTECKNKAFHGINPFDPPTLKDALALFNPPNCYYAQAVDI